MKRQPCDHLRSVLLVLGIIVVALNCPVPLIAADGPRVLVVPTSAKTLHIAAPLTDGAAVQSDKSWELVEAGHPETRVPVQVIPGMAVNGNAESTRAVASIPPRGGASGERRFILETSRALVATGKGAFKFRDVNDKSLGLWEDTRRVLVYNHGVITDPKVPASDSRRSRACFVHPVYGLDGELLTEDFPKDHYHHHGIFWAWPHVGIDGKQYDLWVYDNIQQKFVGWLCREAGPVAAVLGVENGWFVGSKKVMIERVWLRTYRAADGERALDFEFTWIPVDRPISLQGAEGKSYGGLNLRFAPRKDTVITVPGGRTKDDLPDTPLAWADLTAKFAGAPGRSGATIFVDPGHPDFPPTWLTRHYGILCVGWPGVKGKTFPPNVPIRLNYRVLLHKSDEETSQFQQAFDSYAAAMKAKWETK